MTQALNIFPDSCFTHNLKRDTFRTTNAKLFVFREHTVLFSCLYISPCCSSYPKFPCCCPDKPVFTFKIQLKSITLLITPTMPPLTDSVFFLFLPPDLCAYFYDCTSLFTFLSFPVCSSYSLVSSLCLACRRH